MTNTLKLDAEIRTDVGKGASRRLRRTNNIPAIIYGGDSAPSNITLNHNEVIKALENEEFYTQILTLEVAKKPEKVVLKALQRHPYKPKITHMDFLRIKANEALIMQIPLHFVGENVSPGIKAGGTVSRQVSEIEIRCLPADLPKFIEVDVSKMELDSVLHMSDIKLPKGVALTATTGEGHDQPVVSIHLAKIAEAPIIKEEASTEETPAETENNKKE